MFTWVAWVWVVVLATAVSACGPAAGPAQDNQEQPSAIVSGEPAAPDDLIAERALFVDRSGTVSIENVVNQPFQPIPPGTVYLGNRREPTWLRLQLRPSPANMTWWLVLAPPAIHDATLYVPQPEGGWRTVTFGLKHPYAERPVAALNFVAPLRLADGAVSTLFLRLETPSATADVHVVEAHAVLARERIQTIGFMLYFGAVLVTFIVSALAFYITRFPLWLSSAGLDLAAAMNIFILSGLGAAFIMPGTAHVMNALQPTIIFLHVALVANQYYQIAKTVKAPAWIRRAYALSIMPLPFLVALHVVGFAALAARLANVQAVLVCVMLAAFFVASRWDCDRALARTVKALMVAVMVFMMCLYAPWFGVAQVSFEWRQFTVMPPNVFIICMAVFMAFRLSYAEVMEKRRTAAEALEMRRREEAAVSESRAKTAFLVYMSHEIRTPLNAVVGLAELASGDNLSQAQREGYLHMLKQSAVSLASVISNTLDLSKLEAGKLAIEVTAFNLNDWIDGLRSSYQALAQRKQLEFRIVKNDVDIGDVWGDPIRLRQIVENLLSNALKFTDQGGLTLAAHRLGQGRYRFEVHDTGRGLSAEEQRNLFKPYAQAGTDAHEKARGTGVGLAICRELAHLMDGEVGVTSQIGQGSCFWVEVMLAEAVPVTRRSIASVASDALKGRRVLIAEDDELSRTTMEALLRREGAEAVAVADGEEAITRVAEAHAQGQPFDIAFLDVHMQRMDGIEATRRIRLLGEAGSLPIIALTGSVLTEERQKALQAGMNDVLPKPVLLSSLREAVGVHARRPASPGPLESGTVA